MQHYDAVVIGAGNGGLTAAATLAKKGVRVLVLERHNIPGGCATSFCRGRFEFETALHQLSGVGVKANPGSLRPALEAIDVLDKVEFVVSDELYRTVLPGGRDITLKANKKEIIRELQRQFPHEKDKIEEFFEFLYAFFMEVISVSYMNDPDPTREKYPRAFKYMLKTAQEALDDFFQDASLRRVLTTYWGYLGLPPRFMPFVDWALMFITYIEFRPQLVKGCSQALSNAIADTILSHGGEIRYNCAARRIVVEDGRVKGVVTECDEEIGAEFVISNASKVTTYVDLIGGEHLPQGLFAEMGGNSIGASAMSVYVGLDRTPDQLGITNTTTFIAQAADEDREYEATKTAGFGEESALFITCYTKMDPSFSPAGTTMAALVTLQYAKPWLEVPPAQYAAEKYRAASAMLARAETVYPGLREHIEEMEISTPITHMRYLGHPGGAFYGFDQHVRSSTSFVSQKPPIEGLYLTGAWASSGGFQPTLESGVETAQRVLRKLGTR